jgi:hypothetical protein
VKKVFFKFILHTVHLVGFANKNNALGGDWSVNVEDYGSPLVKYGRKKKRLSLVMVSYAAVGLSHFGSQSLLFYYTLTVYIPMWRFKNFNT